MTTEFFALKGGDDIDLKGPLGEFVWLGNGEAQWKGVIRNLKSLGLICGGSGKSLSSYC